MSKHRKPQIPDFSRPPRKLPGGKDAPGTQRPPANLPRVKPQATSAKSGRRGQ